MAFTDRLANRGSISTATAFDVDNSCKLEADNTEYFTRDVASAGNRDVGTISMWIKRTELGTAQYLFTFGNTDSDTGRTFAQFNTDNSLSIEGGSTVWRKTSRVFRDCAAWMHIVIAFDTTDGTANDMFKLYINGVRETSFATTNNPSQNADLGLNFQKQVIGYNSVDSASPFCGYIAEVVIQDGVASAPTEFGEFDSDSGIWKPIDPSGVTFGTNGAYMDFEASGNLGNDVNGGTDFTETNIAAADQVTDTPTNNFCTMMPPQNSDYGTEVNVTNGGLTISGGAASTQTAHGSIGVRSGKWYYETTMSVLLDDAGGENHGFGWLGADQFTRLTVGAFPSGGGDTWSRDIGMWRGWACAGDGNPRHNNSHSGDGYSGTAQEDVVRGCALDMDNGKIWWSLGGTWLTQDSGVGNPATGAYPSFTNLLSIDVEHRIPAVGNYTQAGVTTEVNFGCPVYAVFTGVGTNADANGYGSFSYAPPSGFYALCSKNLAEFGGSG